MSYPSDTPLMVIKGGLLAIRRVKRRKKSAETKKIEHFLIPKHELVAADEEKKILEKYNVTKDQLPRIRSDDPAIQTLDVKKGNIIRILRKEDHIENTYYRVVV